MNRSRVGLLVVSLRLLGIVLGIVCISISAAAQVPLPHAASNLVLDDLVDVEVVTFDAGTLPLRAHVEVELIRPPTHPDLEVELRMTCPLTCPFGGTFDSTSTLGPGDSTSRFSLAQNCAPTSPFPGVECNIEAKALSFGTGGGPASIDLTILGYTRVPTHTERVEIDPVPVQKTLTFGADRDTTLYEENGDWNNGLGNSMWAGRHYHGSFPRGQFYDLHGMMTFDVGAPLFPTPGTIPSTATLDDAVITLRAIENRGPIGTVSISAVTDVDNSPFTPNNWYSGTTDAPGSEIESVVSTSAGATWEDREFPREPWNIPGAGTGPILDIASVPSFGQGVFSFSSPALTDEIRTMWSTRRTGMGFQVRGFSALPTLVDQAVRFGSKDHPVESFRPELLVYYTPEFTDPYEDNNLATGAVTFIGEGENFRWIYDEDEDDVLFTEIGGRCEETQLNEGGGLSTVPYNYSYSGDPNYVGLDCCTWQIESQATETIGTGQALFFLNLDAIPENFPPDTDGDGIVNLCDNCVYTPNGPLMGTCVGGPDDMETCRSNLECGAPSFCSLSQEDDDFELPGQACPEPGLGVMLMVGTLSIVRRRHSN